MGLGDRAYRQKGIYTKFYAFSSTLMWLEDVHIVSFYFVFLTSIEHFNKNI